MKFLFYIWIFLVPVIAFAQQSNYNSAETIQHNKNARYNYYPNIYAYHDLLNNVYYYYQNNTWNKSEELPKNIGGYSTYRFVNVAINDYDGEEPYLLFDQHKVKYPPNFKGKKK